MSVNIFDHMNYRDFLREYYEQKKNLRSGFSYRSFSKLAGLGGKNYLKDIIDGKRNLSALTTQKFAKALKFTKKEAEYFENLVLYNQAKTDADRDLYFDRLLEIKPLKQVRELTQMQTQYLRDRNYLILREMISLPQFREDAAWIANQFDPPLDKKSISDMIHTLLKLGVIERDSKGFLKNTGQLIRTSPEDAAHSIYNLHRDAIQIARDAVFKHPENIRDISLMIIPLSEDKIPEIKKVIAECRQRIAKIVHKTEENDFDIFQMSVQFFPVTQTRKNGS